MSADVQRTASVTKIEHGRKSNVSIVTTLSGTYSSDAITSPHVLYPGIHVEALPPEPVAVAELQWLESDSFAYLILKPAKAR